MPPKPANSKLEPDQGCRIVSMVLVSLMLYSKRWGTFGAYALLGMLAASSFSSRSRFSALAQLGAPPSGLQPPPGLGIGGGLGLGGGGGGGLGLPPLSGGGGGGMAPFPGLGQGGGGGMAPGMAGGMPPTAEERRIQQLQDKALEDPRLEELCSGKTRKSTDIGAECWAQVWANGGCKAENAPPYTDWHKAQSLETLVMDVVQWANLEDDRHKTGCYGDQGPPPDQPMPQAPPPGMMGHQQQPPGPPPPPEVMQKIQSSLESPQLPTLCPGVDRRATDIGEACLHKIWTHVGCKAETAPSYDQWYKTQSFEVLVADSAQWASLPTEKHRLRCYGDATGAVKAEL